MQRKQTPSKRRPIYKSHVNLNPVNQKSVKKTTSYLELLKSNSNILLIVACLIIYFFGSTFMEMINAFFDIKPFVDKTFASIRSLNVPYMVWIVLGFVVVYFVNEWKKEQGRTLYGKTRNSYKPDPITDEICKKIKSLEIEKQSMDEVAKIVCELITSMMSNVKATPKAQERMRNYLTIIVEKTFVGQKLFCINDNDYNVTDPSEPDCHKLTALINGLGDVIDSINASGCDAATWMRRADEELAKVLKNRGVGKYSLKCPKLKAGVESYLFNYYTTHFCLSAGWYEVFITDPVFLKLAQEGRLFANIFGEGYTIFSNSKQSVTIDKILRFLISSCAVILTGDSPKDIDMVLHGITTLSFATCVFKDGVPHCKAQNEADFIFWDMKSVDDMARVQRILFELRDFLKSQ